MNRSKTLTWYLLSGLAPPACLVALLAGPCPAGAETRQRLSPERDGTNAASHLVQARGLRYRSRSDSTRVIVDLRAQVNYDSRWLPDPERFYVDLFNARIHSALEVPPIPDHDPFLRSIRIAQRRRQVVRVVFDLNSEATPSVVALSNPPRLIVEWKARSPGPVVVQTTPAPATVQSLAPAVYPKRTITAQPAPADPAPFLQAASDRNPQRYSVSGEVLDPSQAAVPGAKVTLRAQGKRPHQAVTTDPDGRFAFPALPPGHYRLLIEKEGFKAHRIKVRLNPHFQFDV